MTCHKFEAEEIASVFEENGVKHTVEKYSLGVIQSPFDSRNMKDDQNIYVDYSDIEAANAVLQKYDEGKEEETVPDDMPRGKRIALDIIGIVLFMIIVSLVVFASDYVANGLRNFFNRAEIGMIKELCSWLII
ncbi:MAG: hypothetical protein Q4C42_06095 [Clostridia bacterium]|nr:hypothetical protein [Clostridia bacterium]